MDVGTGANESATLRLPDFSKVTVKSEDLIYKGSLPSQILAEKFTPQFEGPLIRRLGKIAREELARQDQRATDLLEGAKNMPVNEDGTVTFQVMKYETKDSGVREQYESGMVRDVNGGKPRFDLMIPKGIPFEELYLTRVARLYERGAVKYAPRNWEKANSQEELDRALESAFRHFMQWYAGEDDEDHAAAVFFNINEAETIRSKMHEAETRELGAAIQEAQTIEQLRSAIQRADANKLQ